MFPNFRYEKRIWRQGVSFIAGADEVGRGCLAGPVVAAAVVFPHNSVFIMPDSVKIDDSKKLKSRQREKASLWIKKNCRAFGIGEVGTTYINRLGIGRATKMAFRRALLDCSTRAKRPIEFLLVDTFYVPHTAGLRRKNQLAVIKGDAKAFSIAAASIVAKVYRDRLMQSLSKRYAVYGWGRNKGYGTKEHQEAILKHGITPLHRKTFVRKLLNAF